MFLPHCVFMCMNITIIALRQTISFSHLGWPRDVKTINKLCWGSSRCRIPTEMNGQHGHILCSLASWRQGVRWGKSRRGRRVLGSNSCTLAVLLGMLLIKMSLSIPWTSLIHPRNLYIHSLIRCILQRLSPLIHVIFICLDLSFIKLVFISLSVCSQY